MKLQELKYWIHLGITTHNGLVKEIAKLDELAEQKAERTKFINEIKEIRYASKQ